MSSQLNIVLANVLTTKVRFLFCCRSPLFWAKLAINTISVAVAHFFFYFYACYAALL